MVRIRLRRVGKIRQAGYRVVVADSESPRNGKFIEAIGFYSPLQDPPTVEIQADRALYWLSLGAQPSDAVARMLRQIGVMARFEALKAKSVQETVEEAKAPTLDVAAAEAASDAEQDAA